MTSIIVQFFWGWGPAGGFDSVEGGGFRTNINIMKAVDHIQLTLANAKCKQYVEETS